MIATYPEWDAAAGTERPAWTTLRDVPARIADPAPLLAAMAGSGLRGPIARLVRGAMIGRPARLTRQQEGEELDMDAAIDAMIALRGGLVPEARLHRATRPRSRDLATLILLDASASTAAALADGRSVLDLQRLAVALLGEALEARGDPLALRAFASDGREDVRLMRLKEFGEPFRPDALGRLAGLGPGLSTRLGTALRHAGAELAPRRAWRRLVLVLTDGEAANIDAPDSAELVTDARRAVAGLRQAGIDAFGVILDPAGAGAAEAIFGRANTLPILSLPDLPSRLASLCFRLARR